MMTFKDLEWREHPMANGKQGRAKFPNGYGVSVVRFKLSGSKHYGSYTDNENEWELAVFHDDQICYATSIGDDVLGHQLEGQVTEIMTKLQALPKNAECTHVRK